MTAKETADPPTELADPVEILLIDDDEAWLRGTARLLENENPSFSITTANSVANGHTHYAEAEFDCLVCDYQLGDGTGLSLLETVRDQDHTVPFILVTGRGDEQIASTAIQKDITDYVIKHEDNDTTKLTDAIVRAVSTYRTQRSLERERRSKSSLLELLATNTDSITLCEEVCSLLVDTHGYACAWVGRTQQSGLLATAAAGADGYVDELLSMSESTPSEPAFDGINSDVPVFTSVSEQPTNTEPPWHSLAREYGFEEAAAVPLDYEAVQFGVLCVYTSDQPHIGANRLDSLSEFADTLGYALQTLDVKQSRGSDQPVRASIEITDTTVPLIRFSQALSEAQQMDVPSVVLRDDSATLYLVQIEEETEEGVEAALDAEQQFAIAGEQPPTEVDGCIQCSIVTTEPTPEAMLAEQGIHIIDTAVDSHKATITAELPDHDSVSTSTEMLESKYDDVVVSVVKQDSKQKTVKTVNTLFEPLTGKQQTAIEHAYHGGFFNHPRNVTATELADQFDVTRQTITHHLRAAERKLFDQLIDTE